MPRIWKFKKRQGNLFTDAKVLINDHLSPMPGMARMNYRTEAKLKKEKYRAR